MSQTEQPAGPVLDGLGVTVALGEGDLVASALVVAKVVDADGDVALLIGHSDGMSWLEQIGLITAASDTVRRGRLSNDLDD